ncbi:MAG: FeoB small GTPase domain-containing protein, partial [Candidatus Njordarchaeota archaeon]
MEKGIIPRDLRETHKVIALVGQPNVGKSTIYNRITGELQHIGNWPGKTVEVAWSKVEFENEKVILVDLPGTYTLSGFTEEEEVTIEFILHEKPDAIIVITDVSALPRNLYLLLQVLEITNRVILVVNMMDEAERWGIKVDLSKLRSIFGIPVIGTVAIRGAGLEDMLRAALKVAKKPPKPSKIRYPNIECYIEEIEEIIKSTGIDNPRFMAIRIVEGDYKILKELPEEAAIKIEGVLEKMKFVFKRDPRLIIASERYLVIDSIMLETFSKKTLADSLTEKLDNIFFKRGLDMIFSFAILFLSFLVAYQIGYFLLEILDMVLSACIVDPIDAFLANTTPSWAHSLIVDGIIGGIVFALTFL